MTREEQIDWLCRLRADLNNGIIFTPWNKEFTEALNKALEQELCEDAISRKSIKQKLQEHHDFFVNAYGGFKNLPRNDKSRVDEITNCIAMVVNEPPVTSQSKQRIGHWTKQTDDHSYFYACSACGERVPKNDFGSDYFSPFCPECGAMMEVEDD